MSDKLPNALLHGTLDALILKTLARVRGTAMRSPASSRTPRRDGARRRRLALSGALSPGAKGWVEAEWGTSELGRRAKLYRMTDAGREQLAAAMATWKKFAAGVSKVLFAS